jgi:hypothetical protein
MRIPNTADTTKVRPTSEFHVAVSEPEGSLFFYTSSPGSEGDGLLLAGFSSLPELFPLQRITDE